MFHEMIEVAATHSMLKGRRPSRPDCDEVSSLVWQMIQSCWDPAAQRRMTIGEAVVVLEAELGRVAARVGV